MKPDNPTHSAIWAQELLGMLTKRGISARDALKGITSKPPQSGTTDAEWSFENTLKLFERAAELTDDNLIGFHFSQSPDLVRKAGLLAYVGVSAPTVGGYLRNITRFQRVLGDASKSAMEDLPDQMVLRWHYDISSVVPSGQYAEFGAVGTVYALRDYSNRQLRPLRVRFAHQRQSGVETLNQFFGCRVQFGCDENEIAFKASDTRVPLLTADDNLQRALLEICENTLANLPQRPNSVSRKVERLITAGLASGTAHQDKIAAELGMSPRTLARRLAEEGTSFATLITDLRAALARDYLRNSNLPLTEIAFLLGYTDASSFSTAFRRWFKTTPREYRENPESSASSD